MGVRSFDMSWIDQLDDAIEDGVAAEKEAVDALRTKHYAKKNAKV